MHCKSCNYPLWQIPDRRCPECGVGFKPSDFEFVLNSVRFCCPHCNQDYYGTGDKGHLVPSEFTCVTCSRPISMDTMVLLPTAGVREEQTKVESNPWLERREKGLIRGWFFTVIYSLGIPARLIRATPEGAPLGQALWFAVFTNLCYTLVGAGIGLSLIIVIGVIIAASVGGGGRGGGGAALAAPIGAVAGLTLVIALFFFLLSLIWAAITHALLRLTGSVAFGIGRTTQCILYSSGTNFINAVPCINIYFGWIGAIWWSVSATLMVKEAQRVSSGRAAFATLSFPIVMILLAVIGIVSLFLLPMRSGLAAAQAAAVQAQTTSIASTSEMVRITQLADAIKTHAAEYGAPPAHAIELTDSQLIWVSAFLQDDSNQFSRLETTTVVGISLNDLSKASGETADTMLAAAAASLPANVIAHRIGDTVFCYHGINFAEASPLLWTVISSPESPASATSSIIVVGRVDGATNSFDVEGLALALSHQNALRADAGLPPLPDPSTITVDKPAVAD